MKCPKRGIVMKDTVGGKRIELLIRMGFKYLKKGNKPYAQLLFLEAVENITNEPAIYFGLALSSNNEEDEKDNLLKLFELAGSPCEYEEAYYSEDNAFECLKMYIRVYNRERIVYLLDRFPALKHTNPTMLYAVSCSNHSVIELLIEQGVDIDLCIVEYNENNTSFSSRSALSVALSSRDYSLIALLISGGADINQRVYSLHEGIKIADSPLTLAIHIGDLKIIEMLLLKGNISIEWTRWITDEKTKERKSIPPMICAMYDWQHEESRAINIIRTLLSHGIDPREQLCIIDEKDDKVYKTMMDLLNVYIFSLGFIYTIARVFQEYYLPPVCLHDEDLEDVEVDINFEFSDDCYSIFVYVTNPTNENVVVRIEDIYVDGIDCSDCFNFSPIQENGIVRGEDSCEVEPGEFEFFTFEVYGDEMISFTEYQEIKFDVSRWIISDDDMKEKPISPIRTVTIFVDFSEEKYTITMNKNKRLIL